MPVVVRYLMPVLLALMLSSCAEQSRGAVKQEIVEPVAQASTLVFEPADVDLGTLKEGDDVVAYLRVRNSGETIQQIVDVQTSCGCSVAEPEESLLMPGGFTRIRVTIDTFAKQDDIRKWVLLTDADGKTSKAWLTFAVRPNPHMGATQRSIFDGKCAACHFEPAKGKVAGIDIFRAVCAMCHGDNGAGGVAPSLRHIRDRDILTTLIANGTGSQHMPGFAAFAGGPLTEKQVSALSEWLSKLDE
ncbi:Cytochrome C oxidase, cbb3-type, subunit III [Mariprofundus aestuarium]|uniref:Cytochrome C oxidase, cbb3-type, subunit III n=1 Tax=Mariprofundus aestuarium TaxID=1921086 RepID=A0A2K8L345_MARES|nr:DUF1573 domain-containing protein [Mariprofundus aestuarium]ATX79384.1 Cytochrome C oxidase, cbb3-type, subunit III [Mariprofundus aestuarium]